MVGKVLSAYTYFILIDILKKTYVLVEKTTLVDSFIHLKPTRLPEKCVHRG